MKTVSYKLTVTLGSLALAAYANLASAHTQAGSLGTNPNATDAYNVVCSNDGNGNTTLMSTQITSTQNFCVQSVKGGAATNTCSLGGTSTAVNLTGSNGNYPMLVDKGQGTSAGGSYSVTFHCLSGSTHTGTSISTSQNQ